jgi:hypothetical protein
MPSLNEVPAMRIVRPLLSSHTRFHRSLSLAAVCSLTAVALQFVPAATACAADEENKDSGIIIRPANFDPADELAYTRARGELQAGASATGKYWNMPIENSRAAVSGEAPAPAGQGTPVSAASGAFVPRMTYAEAYAMVPFSRTEYEANPAYRHDAAMELVFGTMRPTVNARMTLPYFSRYPDLFRYRFPVFPYLGAGSGDGWSNTNMWWNTSLIAW